VEVLSNLKLIKYAGKKRKLSTTLQVAARLVGRGTKKMGRSPTTLMQYEDFSGCSQARGARHEEKSDASLRHSCSTRTFQVAARLVGRGTKKNRTLAYDTHVARGLSRLQPGS
jgi:hypothetical protein